MVEPNDLSLYDELSSRGFEAAIVATYNASFGFYERVLLRRLQAVGCRAHLLLTDARQCSRAFATEEDLPEQLRHIGLEALPEHPGEPGTEPPPRGRRPGGH